VEARFRGGISCPVSTLDLSAYYWSLLAVNSIAEIRLSLIIVDGCPQVLANDFPVRENTDRVRLVAS